jgi:hypothetical protein
MMVIAVPECQLLKQCDYTLQILHKAKPVPSVSSGTGLATSSSGSGYKFTSAMIPSAKNVVSILYKLLLNIYCSFFFILFELNSGWD